MPRRGAVTREQLEIWAPIARPASLKADVTPQLDDLLNETGAAIVALWAVGLDLNSVQFLQARQRGGGAWNFRPRRAPAILDPKAVAELLAGHPICLDLTVTVHGLVSQRLAADGMGYVCFVPVRNSGLLAVLALAWKVRPAAALEAAALGLAAHDSAAMVMR